MFNLGITLPSLRACASTWLAILPRSPASPALQQAGRVLPRVLASAGETRAARNRSSTGPNSLDVLYAGQVFEVLILRPQGRFVEAGGGKDEAVCQR